MSICTVMVPLLVYTKIYFCLCLLQEYICTVLLPLIVYSIYVLQYISVSLKTSQELCWICQWAFVLILRKNTDCIVGRKEERYSWVVMHRLYPHYTQFILYYSQLYCMHLRLQNNKQNDPDFLKSSLPIYEKFIKCTFVGGVL